MNQLEEKIRLTQKELTRLKGAKADVTEVLMFRKEELAEISLWKKILSVGYINYKYNKEIDFLENYLASIERSIKHCNDDLKVLLARIGVKL